MSCEVLAFTGCFKVDVQPFGWFLLTSQFLFSLARLSSLNSHNLRIWDNRSVKRVEEQSFHIQILIPAIAKTTRVVELLWK